MHDITAIKFDKARMESGIAAFKERQNDPARMAASERDILDNRLSGWGRLGAFDPRERVRALDLFGYEHQLILPTFSFHQFAHDPDPDVLETGSRVLNRALGEFSHVDKRLKPVGYVPLQLGPEKALDIMNAAFADGCYSFTVDTNEPNDNARSFTHPDFDPVWARFVEAGVPAVAHIAVNGHYEPVSKSFRNNARVFHEVGGDAPPGELGIMTLANSVQLFLGAMIYDGVFERHPKLRIISMEHGSLWLPGWLLQIDFTANVFKRLRSFSEMPSVTAKRHIKVAPFAGEPVGWVIDQVGPDMLVYASDYPHPEGSEDPIKRFESTMTKCDQATLDAFYYKNMAEAMNLAR